MHKKESGGRPYPYNGDYLVLYTPHTVKVSIDYWTSVAVAQALTTAAQNYFLHR